MSIAKNKWMCLQLFVGAAVSTATETEFDINTEMDMESTVLEKQHWFWNHQPYLEFIMLF